MRAIAITAIILVIVGFVCADVYLQGMIKGCNNRLNEPGATRTSNNRLFNSQNNNRGGCNVGEYTTANGGGTDIPNIDYDIKRSTPAQYPETFYEGSEVILAWTNQHGCGGNPLTDPHNTHCNIVIQYTCDTIHEDRSLKVKLRNGSSTNQPGSQNTVVDCETDDDTTTGRHESRCWQGECSKRSRNKNLFTADQNLAGETARYTRQNANGNQSGLECEEERDYFPYWTPSPWRDVAYLTSELNATNIDPCQMVKDNTMNTQKKFKCRAPSNPPTTVDFNSYFEPITAEECAEVGGEWVGYSWNIPEPHCGPAPWSRDNHLGASRDGYYTNYTWSIPPLSEVFSGDGVTVPADTDIAKCVVRIRYNITTADYDPWNTFSESNAGTGVSPVTNNPRVNVGGPSPLRLALNTAQTGRTFQDRSHVFTIRKRPSELVGKRIVNQVMIGKRGNIVETYPGVEYLWMPSHPVLAIGDVLHIQWTGSNTANNNGNPGDGQAGDAGQGKGGTERHNWVLTKSEAENWPIPLDLYDDTLFDKSTCHRVSGKTSILPLTRNECAITLASSGFYTSPALDDTHSDGNNAMDANMDNAPASLVGGVLLQPNTVGSYPFICSRDNNFTNRDQKGVIYVVDAIPPETTDP